MFRISKILENEKTSIFKIEGKIIDSDLSAWADEVGGMTQDGEHQIIFDCCSVSSISPKALTILLGRLSDGIYLVNCPVGVKNMLQSAGRSKNILD
jgi:hypothetical protein